jgi:hypothetical protein
MSYDAWKMTEPVDVWSDPEPDEIVEELMEQEHGTFEVELPGEPDLYREAVTEGIKQYHLQVQTADTGMATKPVLGPNGPGYWIARHAARETAGKMLKMAASMGLSDAQYEALRATAATVAYD